MVKSKTLESWVGRVVRVDKSDGGYVGELVEFGSCWVVLRDWGIHQREMPGEILIRLGGSDTIELAEGEK